MVFYGLISFAQSGIERQVFGSQGSTGQTKTIIMDWTIGESIVAGSITSFGTLNAGFQQTFRKSEIPHISETKDFSINIVPNPYYGFSAYEINEFATTIKMTNLPPKCKVSIYTLDGKFIRQFNRDEKPTPYPEAGLYGNRSKQIVPALEWDMKNDKNIPVSSGVYLINVDAGALGSRTLKFFAVNRQFDPSRL